MTTSAIASVVRPGEHACARPGRFEDHQALAIAFMRHGLDQGHRVLCLGEAVTCAQTMDALHALDPRAAPALGSGQLLLRSSRAAYLPDGRFDMRRMVQQIRDEHAAALSAGYPALSITGDMAWAFEDTPGTEALIEYERQLNDEAIDTLLILCRYDQRNLAVGGGDIAGQHCVDIAPELAALARVGNLAAARADAALRLAGDLDYSAAEALSPVLAAHFHGPLIVDLGDLEFVDVAGMRALRGRKGEPLRIVSASSAVERLVGLLGWDTDPAVNMGAAA